MIEKEEGQPDRYRFAVSAYNVFRRSQLGVDAIGHPIPDFEDSGQGARPWILVVEQAYEILDDAHDLPWMKFAEDLYEAWRGALGQLPFETLTPQTQFAFQAVARHITSVVASETDDPESSESTWDGWAIRRAEELKPVTP